MIDIKQFQNSMKLLFQGDVTAGNDLGLRIEHQSFSTQIKVKQMKPGIMKGDLFYHEMLDADSPENFNFTYPVVLPTQAGRSNKGLLLLHGLNEKSWDKYLTWAGQLALKLNCPVLMFPIAYHMNRAPKEWSDPRIMRNVVQTRLKIGKKNESTFANAALSTRLGSNPEQFIFSGLQSYYDCRQLLKQIIDGEHPLFEKHTTLDVFAYSIGAFLAQILFIGNPDQLLTHSRLFLFAGGTTFDKMVGNSRFIFDLKAFHSLLTLRNKRVLRRTYELLRPAKFYDFDNTWQSFLAMLSQRRGRKARIAILAERGNQLYALALERDQVMPVKYIVRTLKGKNFELPPRVDVIDFPYDYTHENPFPLNNETIMPLVNRSFAVLMEKATRFYTQPLTLSENEFYPSPQMALQMG
jgi:hypothetical protein